MAAAHPDRPSQKSESATAAKALEETQVSGSPNELAETNVPGHSVKTDRAPQKAPAEGGSRSGSQEKNAAVDQKKPVKKVTQLGDFKLEKKLGQGGMGTVFLATQISLDRKVALKTLSPELAKKPDFVQRFLREARSMAKLHHPNIVQVFAADSFSGVHYAAIEFVDGQSMQRWMDQLKQISVGDALHVILVCAEALRQAHDQNMIHRDIKPDNILLTSKGVVKVADFGLAKALDEDVSMTQSGTGLGTPLYMAPEQARNAKHVDKRSDIYALGSTLYYFLTGKLPFTGESTLELILAKEKGVHASARKLNPQVPERLDLMISKMLLKDPNHRYADCADIIRDLQGLNLANPTLSFIEGAQPIGLGTASVVSRVQPTKVPTAGATRAVTSADDAARTQSRAPLATAAQSGKTWYVRHKTPDGKLSVNQMSTGEIMAGIKGETLDIAAKVKDSVNGSFLPLSQFREFDALMQHRVVKAQADAKSQKTQNLYAKFDRQEARRRRWRWVWNFFENVKGLVSFLVYLAILVVIGFSAWRWGFQHVPVLKKFGPESQQSAPASIEKAPDAAPPAAPVETN